VSLVQKILVMGSSIFVTICYYTRI